MKNSYENVICIKTQFIQSYSGFEWVQTTKTNIQKKRFKDESSSWRIRIQFEFKPETKVCNLLCLLEDKPNQVFT